MLTVSTKDYGPIVAGAVGLKPLTIFMGRSNTGKSYMAAAIYALMTASYNDESTLHRRAMSSARYRQAFRRNVSRGRHRQVLEEYPGVLDALKEWARVQDMEALDSRRFTVSDLPGEVTGALAQSIRQCLDSFSASVIDRLRHIYGEASGFVRRGKEPMDPWLTISQDDPKLHLNIQLSGGRNSMSEFEISQVTVPPSTYEEFPFAGVLDGDDQRIFLRSFYTLEASVIEQAFVGLPFQSLYLPAARSGIVQGHKVLAASLVRQSRRIGIEPVNIPTLPGITTEFLSHLVTLDKSMTRRSRKDDLEGAINFIENEVLQGRIDLDDSDALPYPKIVYEQTVIEPSPGTFTLDHTSSMVSELAPLILFLKYLLTSDDLLILEEPESHLHPGAQRQMARGIARLVNAGIRVIITTHSDMFVAQINNLLRLSHASSRWIREHNFQPQDCLRQDQIGAFLFHYDQTLGGSVIDPLEIDPETGIDEEEFVREIEVVYDEAIALQRIRIK